MVLSDRLFILKTACLLHDPPNKAWLFRDGRDHKKEAERIAISVLNNTCLENATIRMEEVAKPADTLASSVDRWLLGELIGEEYSLFAVKKIKLKNIFNPKFSQEIKQEPPSTEEFTRILREVIKPITNVRLAYHVLYACYEPLWVQLGLPAGPADTRAPSHSVFDHNYATAAMMNWLIGKDKPKGVLLHIDLGGPQRFISGSRKLSDLWLSSYLVSALAWSLFWLFVKDLGPDVMVLPTCRGNPFYYHSLLSELTRNGVNSPVIERIKEISKEFAGYDPDRDKIPRYAVVPVTATFILPELEQLKELNDFKEIEAEKELEGLEEFMRKKYQEIWKGIYDEVAERCKDLQAELGKLATEAGRLLNECRRFGFDTTPPLPIRVIALHTDRLHKLGLTEREHYTLYHYMFKLLDYEKEKRKLYKFRSEEDLKLFEMTSQPIKTWPNETTKGFEYCTVCGYLPAILILPSKEDEYNRHLDIKLEPIFSLGERLCPYCLIKRLLSRSEILKPVMDRLLGELSREKPTCRFIPVCDIALMPFKRSLIEKARLIDEKQPELAKELSKLMAETWGKVSQELRKLKKDIRNVAREEGKPILAGEKELSKVIEDLRTKDLKEDLKNLLFLNTEMGIMGEHELRNIWLDLIGRINKDERMKCYGEPIECPNTHYAIIRCDGDNLGKIIQGKVEEGFKVTIKDYLCNVLEEGAREVVKAILNNGLEEAKKVCKDCKAEKACNNVDKISQLIKNLVNKEEIIISPSYHSTLSKALMANAIRDMNIIDSYDGLTIYAGGDDLLAVTPVKNSLQAIQKLREKFSFPSKEDKGFDRRGNYLIPSLATASRSFSLYFSHFMFPMYSVISRSAELLEEVAKNSEWIVDGAEKGRRKDTLILSYSPRGGERSALLPLSDVKAPDQNLTKNLNDLDDLVSQIEKERGGFSSSLIYDLYYNRQMFKSLIVKKNTTLLEKLLSRVFERNCEISNKQQRKEMAERWARRLIEDFDVAVKVEQEALPFLEQFFLALMLYRSGLRVVE